MIHEFAVDPELLVEWSESRTSFAYFNGSFGLGEPRIVSHYPTDWRARAKSCWDAREARATTEEEKGKLEQQRLRFFELTRKLFEVVVNRTTLAYTNNRTWLDNAGTHAPGALPNILAKQGHGGPAHVLVGEGIVEHPRWLFEKGLCVVRDAEALASAVAPLLKCCAKIVFVDPYFTPLRAAHLRSFEMFVRALSSRVGLSYPGRLEVLTSCEEKPAWNYFKSACEDRMLPLLPVGWRVRVAWLKARGTRGEKLHNRYILTDLGGIVFGVGLDSGAATETDDLSVMSRAQYEKRWDQYAGPTPEFEVDGTNEVTLKREATAARAQGRPGQGRGRWR